MTILRMVGTGRGRTRSWDRKRAPAVDEGGDPGAPRWRGQRNKEAKEAVQGVVVTQSPSKEAVESTPQS